MKFISTRGKAPAIDFAELLLSGTAPDGGLYMPESLPDFSKNIPKWGSISYQELCFYLLQPFVEGHFSDFVLKDLIRKAYAPFSHPEICTIKPEQDYYLLELFHGPTYAFKDYALQLLGHFFEKTLEAGDKKYIFLGSTSGDTGSAAIHALKQKKNIFVVMLHPNRRVSEIQAKQMLTVFDPNVVNLAIQGTFDDCQALVKALFALPGFSKEYSLGAVNSINLVRILIQVAYYFYAYFAFQKLNLPFVISVPSGNFGNAFSAYLASLMGLPVEEIVVASNQNHVLTTFFDTGVYQPKEVVASLSPSMDIQISSNLERYLWLLANKDGEKIQTLYSQLKNQNQFFFDPKLFSNSLVKFTAGFASEKEVRQRINAYYQTTKNYMDPHTAVGVEVAIKKGKKNFLSLATAHPVKFYDRLEQITFSTYPLPQKIQTLLDSPSRCLILPADLMEVKELIENLHKEGKADFWAEE